MDAVRARSGFTLVEMMFATAIFALVVGGAGTFMIGAYRMTKATFATTTLAVQQREVRERLLFRAVPMHDGVVWPGVLSGANDNGVVEGGAKLLMAAPGVDLSTGASVAPAGNNLHIVRHSSGSGGYFANDGDQTQRDRWLRPMDAACVPESWVQQTTDGSAVFVTLGGALDGVGVTNQVVFPRFGAVQPTPSTGRFKEGG